MPAAPHIAVIGTLDTKGAEIEYVAEKIRELGGRPVVIDSGVLGEPEGGARADIPRAEVAAAGGHGLDDVRAAGNRAAAIALMGEGVREVVLGLRRDGRLDGALCLGGAEGAQLGAVAMHALPLGVPKLIVSPSASGRRAFAPFIGATDTTVMHSVVDILGLNAISRAVFANAAAAIVGMAASAREVHDLGEASVGVTMLGQTTPGVMAMLPVLREQGLEPIVFHANGVGGPAMEAFVRQGGLAGVVDYSLSELANSIKAGVHATGPERGTVAGAHGLPQVVVPGCCDFFNRGGAETLSDEERARQHYPHNAVATLVRLSPEEMGELGRMVAARLNGSTGPVRVVVPTLGFSLIDVPGGPHWNPEADAAFVDALEAGLKPAIPVERVEANVNEPDFGRLVAERYLALWAAPARV